MMQTDLPEDFIVATGETHTVRDFAKKAFAVVGIDVEFKGTGIHEVGVHAKDESIIITVNSSFFRPTEPVHIVGDASKALQKLNWRPSYSVAELVEEMVSAQKKEISKQFNLDSLTNL